MTDWPNLPNYRDFTPEQHAAHTTAKGVHRIEDLYPDDNSSKQTRMLKKLLKPHLKQPRWKTTRTHRRKKKP